MGDCSAVFLLTPSIYGAAASAKNQTCNQEDEPTSQGASISAPGGTGMDVDSDDGCDTPEQGLKQLHFLAWILTSWINSISPIC